MDLLRRLFARRKPKPAASVRPVLDPPPSVASAPTPVSVLVPPEAETPAPTEDIRTITGDWVTIEALDLFGQRVLSPNRRFALVTGSIIRAEPTVEGERDGAYAVLDHDVLSASGSVERPHDARIADNGAFIINDWMHGGGLCGRFLGFHSDGRSAFAHMFSANLACNGLSDDGRYAACQTLRSPGSPDDTLVALVDLEAGELLARFRPECGTAAGFHFAVDLGQFHVLTNDGDREIYGLDGVMIDRPSWQDRRIARGDLTVIASLLKTLADPPDAMLVEKLRSGIAKAASQGDPWTRARANRLDGEVLEELGQAAEALDAYERALLLDPQVGVARRADKLRKAAQGSGAKPAKRRSRFQQQADRLGVTHIQIPLEMGGPKLWRLGGDRLFSTVEDAALDHFIAEGWSGAAAEGGLVLTLIKAASFARLAPRNADTFIEALYHQNVSFEEDRFDPEAMIAAIRRATLAQLAGNWEIISATAGTTPAHYPGVTWNHVEGLYAALGNERLAAIAAIFATAPYDLRAGWPDLTLWRGKEIRFVEVKAPRDQMHASQSRLIAKLLVPLGFDVTLAEVKARV